MSTLPMFNKVQHNVHFMFAAMQKHADSELMVMLTNNSLIYSFFDGYKKTSNFYPDFLETRLQELNSFKIS